MHPKQKEVEGRALQSGCPAPGQQQAHSGPAENTILFTQAKAPSFPCLCTHVPPKFQVLCKVMGISRRFLTGWQTYWEPMLCKALEEAWGEKEPGTGHKMNGKHGPGQQTGRRDKFLWNSSAEQLGENHTFLRVHSLIGRDTFFLKQCWPSWALGQLMSLTKEFRRETHFSEKEKRRYAVAALGRVLGGMGGDAETQD